jgi:hypothetical protein
MFKSTIAILALTSLFTVSAASISGNSVIGNTTTHSTGSVEGFKVTDSYRSQASDVGGQEFNAHQEGYAESDYKGTTYGNSNVATTYVGYDGLNSEFSYSTYTGSSNNGSAIKYSDSYDNHSHTETTTTGNNSDSYEHVDTYDEGSSKSNVSRHTQNSNISGWEVTWAN